MIKYLSYFLAYTTILFSLTSCTSSPFDFETPDLKILSLEPIPASLVTNGINLGVDVKVHMQLQNPNNRALNFNGMSYTLKVNQKQLIDGVSNDLPMVEAYDTATFYTVARINIKEGLALFGSFMQSPSRTLSYELDAQVDTGLPIIGKVNSQKKGSLDLLGPVEKLLPNSDEDVSNADDE